MIVRRLGFAAAKDNRKSGPDRFVHTVWVLAGRPGEAGVEQGGSFTGPAALRGRV